jgi:hypothetical protein
VRMRGTHDHRAQCVVRQQIREITPVPREERRVFDPDVGLADSEFHPDRLALRGDSSAKGIAGTGPAIYRENTRKRV